MDEDLGLVIFFFFVMIFEGVFGYFYGKWRGVGIMIGAFVGSVVFAFGFFYFIGLLLKW